MINSSVIWFLLTLQIVWGVQSYKKCNTSSWKNNGCPSGSLCAEIEVDDSKNAGECHCTGDNYEFNKYYKNDSDYCVYVEPKKHVDNRAMASKSSPTSDEEAAYSASTTSSHHILSGISISICLVVVFTLIVIGFKKLQIKQRIRNLRMTQRNRPLYEDVMMGNDNDDPPLI